MVRSLYLKPLHDIARHGRQGGSLKAPWWLPAVSARCWQSDTSVDEQCYKQVRSPAIETGFTQAGLLLASTELCNSSLFFYLIVLGCRTKLTTPSPSASGRSPNRSTLTGAASSTGTVLQARDSLEALAIIESGCT